LGRKDWQLSQLASSNSATSKNASEAPNPRLALDCRRMFSGQAMQIVASGVPSGTVIEAMFNGKAIAEATAELPAEDSALGTAVFSDLPTGEITFRLRDNQQVQTPAVHIVSREAELSYLALDEARLRNLAETSGGAYRGIDQLERLLLEIEPKHRVERAPRLWRFWESPFVLALLIGILTVEWVWRKLAGRV
jgi:hypothetical protein